MNSIPWLQPPGCKMLIPMGGEKGHKSQTADRDLVILRHFLNLLCYRFSKALSFSFSFAWVFSRLLSFGVGWVVVFVCVGCCGGVFVVGFLLCGFGGFLLLFFCLFGWLFSF